MSLIPLIDSAEFQRLRNIRQTGYEALYPSALHNRFVHSMGVYHLGKKAIHCFKKNVCDKFCENHKGCLDSYDIDYRKCVLL